jgi:hypothetical protein
LARRGAAFFLLFLAKKGAARYQVQAFSAPAPGAAYGSPQ